MSASVSAGAQKQVQAIASSDTSIRDGRMERDKIARKRSSESRSSVLVTSNDPSNIANAHRAKTLSIALEGVADFLCICHFLAEDLPHCVRWKKWCMYSRNTTSSISKTLATQDAFRQAIRYVPFPNYFLHSPPC